MVALGNADARHQALRDLVAALLRFDEPFAWSDFSRAMDTLQSVVGDRILRVKGLLAVRGEDKPRVVHAVQHVGRTQVGLRQHRIAAFLHRHLLQRHGRLARVQLQRLVRKVRLSTITGASDTATITMAPAAMASLTLVTTMFTK